MAAHLCFYHAPCNDGAASAAALESRILRQANGSAVVEFIPTSFTPNWDEPFPEEHLSSLSGSYVPVERIWIVDISLSPAKITQVIDRLRELGRLAPEARPYVVCIDHHKTALDFAETLRTYCDELVIEIGPGLSGATLVWRYFNDTDEALETPLLLRYVADQDIWEWRLPDSREVNAALNQLDGHVETMREELRRSQEDPESWLAERRTEGSIITSVIRSQVLKAYSRVLELEGVDGVLLRIVNATDNASELGNELCIESDSAPDVIAVIYTVQRDWSIKVSLRSIPGGKITSRQIAERFGGGGHDHASGCRFGSFAELQAAIDELAK